MDENEGAGIGMNSVNGPDFKDSLSHSVKKGEGAPRGTSCTPETGTDDFSPVGGTGSAGIYSAHGSQALTRSAPTEEKSLPSTPPLAHLLSLKPSNVSVGTTCAFIGGPTGKALGEMMIRDTWSDECRTEIAAEIAQGGALDIEKVLKRMPELRELLTGIDGPEGNGKIDGPFEFKALAQKLVPGDFQRALEAGESRISKNGVLGDFLKGDIPFVVRTPDGQYDSGFNSSPKGIYAGSFNPCHQGHRNLRAKAEEMLGGPVIYEIAVHNCYKPPLDFLSIMSRGRQFEDQPVVFTDTAKFVEKAKIFPDTTFIVGMDVVEYMLKAPSCLKELEETKRQGCSFLVASRKVDGKLLTLRDVSIPREFKDMFRDIPEGDFRFDISSTEIRKDFEAKKAKR